MAQPSPIRHRMSSGTISWLLVGAMLCPWLIGCASGPEPAWRQPVRLNPMARSSTVFDAPRLQRAKAEADLQQPGKLAWYEGRNDLQPTVYDGYASQTLEIVHTREYDRQRHSTGRVYDHHYSTTRRESISTTVR